MTPSDDNSSTAADPSEEPDRLRVVIADDDPLARRMVRDALQSAGVAVIGEAADGREAVELALHYRPDVVLMDVLMPGIDGITAAGQIRDQAPEVRIVMLTTSDDHELALMGLRAGASGYLTKDVDVVRLPGILAGVSAGDAALAPRIAAGLINELRRTPQSGRGTRPVQSDLTGREWEVLDLLDQELSIAEVADRLVLSVDTVRTHVKSLYRKLEIHSRDELAAATRRLRTPASVKPQQS
jgi:NarL family two-component system response regulator LiaR